MILRPSILPVGVLVLMACGGTPPPVPQTTPLEWRPFSNAIFEEAQRDGKLVLLDVGIEGCTACRWMLEGTYGDPEVARRVRANFVPVAVDANANPELGARYLRWAWPATIILTADGEQLLAIRGNKRPRNFLPLLNEALRRARTGEREEDTGVTAEVYEGCVPLFAQLDERQQPRGGWTPGGFFSTSGRLVDATLGEPTHRDHALRTAEQYAELLDPVWGGLFIAARGEGRIYEKRLPQQAHALLAFAYAYAYTGDATWLGHAASVDGYVARFLTDEGGGFYAAQQDVPSRGTMDGPSFFALDDAARVAAGVPVVDRGIYSSLNAEAIEAYAELARITEDSGYRSRALRAGEVLLRRANDGVVAQWDEAPSDEARLRAQASAPAHIVLETQARAGLAFLALFDLTQETRFLEAASLVVSASEQALGADDGGFFSAPASPRLPRQRRPLENALMARLIFGVVDRTHDLAFLQTAEDTLGFALRVSGRPSPRLAAALLLAMRAGTGGLIDISIAGEEGNEGARTLRSAGREIFSAEARVHFDTLRRYPREAAATAFVCTRNACSPPLRDANAVRAAIARESQARLCVSE